MTTEPIALPITMPITMLSLMEFDASAMRDAFSDNELARDVAQLAAAPFVDVELVLPMIDRSCDAPLLTIAGGDDAPARRIAG